jgi:hypothetical protein
VIETFHELGTGERLRDEAAPSRKRPRLHACES